MSEAGVQGRYRWMDFLRGGAVLLVVAWHVVAVPALFGVEVPSVVRAFFDTTSVVRIPLLFLLSGMLLTAAVQKSPAQYFSGKFRHVIWPYVLWLLITVAASGDLGVLGSPWTWLGGPFHLWFLAVLTACLVIGYVCRWVPPWLLALGIIGLDIVWDPSTNVIARFMHFGAYFFVGATIWPVLVRLGAEGWSWPRSRWLEFAGQTSIVWYVAHFAPMLIVCRVAAGTIPPVALYGLTALVGYGVPALLVWGRQWWPWFFTAPTTPRRRRSISSQ